MVESPVMNSPDVRMFFYYFDDVDDFFCNAFTLYHLSLAADAVTEQADLSDLETLLFQGDMNTATEFLQHSVCINQSYTLKRLYLHLIPSDMSTISRFGQILFVLDEFHRACLEELSINMTLTRFSKYVLAEYVQLRRLDLALSDDANAVISFPTLPNMRILNITKEDISVFEIIDIMEHLVGLEELRIRTSVISYNNLNLRRGDMTHIANKVQEDITDEQESIENVMFTVGALEHLELKCISSVPVDIFLIMITLQPKLYRLLISANVVDSKFTSLNFDVLEKLKYEELQLYDNNDEYLPNLGSSKYDEIVHRLKNRDPLLINLTSFPSFSHSDEEESSELEAEPELKGRIHTVELFGSKQPLDDRPAVRLCFYDEPTEIRQFRLKKTRSMIIIHQNGEFVEISSPRLREHLLTSEIDEFIIHNIECRFPLCKTTAWERSKLCFAEMTLNDVEKYSISELTLRECEIAAESTYLLTQEIIPRGLHFEAFESEFSYDDIHRTVANERERLESKHFTFEEENHNSSFVQVQSKQAQQETTYNNLYDEDSSDEESQLLLILAIPTALTELNLCSVMLGEYPLIVLLRQLENLYSLTLSAFPVLEREINASELEELVLCDQGFVEIESIFDAFPLLKKLKLINAIFDDTELHKDICLSYLEIIGSRNVSLNSISHLINHCAKSLLELHMSKSIMPVVSKELNCLCVVSLREMIIPYFYGFGEFGGNCLFTLLNCAPNVEILEYWNCKECKYCGPLEFGERVHINLRLKRLLSFRTDNKQLYDIVMQQIKG